MKKLFAGLGILLLLSGFVVTARAADDLPEHSTTPGLSADEIDREDTAPAPTATTSTVDQVTAAQQARDALRRANRSQLEQLVALTQDQLVGLQDQRQQQINQLKQAEDSYAKGALDAAAKQARLTVIPQYAELIGARLNALNARLLDLSAKIQSRVNQISDQNLKDQLNSSLAQVASSQTKFDSQIKDAITKLTAIKDAADRPAAAKEAHTAAAAAMATSRTITTALLALVNQLPS